MTVKRNQRENIKLSIIILNWNGKELLINCLKSVFKQTLNPYEIIVVDNGSTDGSVKSIKKTYPKVKLIDLDENIGFAAANNKGLDFAKGNYYFILNNDTELDSKCVENIIKNIKTEKNTKIGMYSLKLLYFYEDKVDTLGLSLNKIGLSSDVKSKNDLHKLIGPCGGAAIYKKEMLIEIKDKNGYYDSRFFIYSEDVDLAWRAKNKGWECKYINNSIVHHLHGAATNKLKDPFLYFAIRNRILMFIKNSKPLIITIFPFIFLQMLVLIKYTLKGKFILVFIAVFNGFFNKIESSKKIFEKYS